MQRIIRDLFKNIKFLSNPTPNSIGRWNLKDNSAIKATLANMDCCGDYYCGSPKNYSKNIEKILKEVDTKIDL